MSQKALEPPLSQALIPMMQEVYPQALSHYSGPWALERNCRLAPLGLFPLPPWLALNLGWGLWVGPNIRVGSTAG